MEEENPLEAKEKLEELAEFRAPWSNYLAITTALIAVVAAIATLVSGNLANSSLFAKNDAILAQSKASDQWNYYQAKGIKKNIAESFSKNDESQKAEADRYGREQSDIQKQAEDFQKQAEDSNQKSEKYFEKHHKAAIAVTLFQIAIALSAVSALLRRKSFWLFSIVIAMVGIGFLATIFF